MRPADQHWAAMATVDTLDQNHGQITQAPTLEGQVHDKQQEPLESLSPHHHQPQHHQQSQFDHNQLQLVQYGQFSESFARPFTTEPLANVNSSPLTCTDPETEARNWNESHIHSSPFANTNEIRRQSAPSHYQFTFTHPRARQYDHIPYYPSVQELPAAGTGAEAFQPLGHRDQSFGDPANRLTSSASSVHSGLPSSHDFFPPAHDDHKHRSNDRFQEVPVEDEEEAELAGVPMPDLMYAGNGPNYVWKPPSVRGPRMQGLDEQNLKTSLRPSPSIHSEGSSIGRGTSPYGLSSEPLARSQSYPTFVGSSHHALRGSAPHYPATFKDGPPEFSSYSWLLRSPTHGSSRSMGSSHRPGSCSHSHSQGHSTSLSHSHSQSSYSSSEESCGPSTPKHKLDDVVDRNGKRRKRSGDRSYTSPRAYVCQNDHFYDGEEMMCQEEQIHSFAHILTTPKTPGPRSTPGTPFVDAHSPRAPIGAEPLPEDMYPQANVLAIHRIPADEDFDCAESCKPRTQKLRFEEDHYTPKWIRKTGQAREGWCSLCPGNGRWLQMKNSAFWYHRQFQHGVSSVSGHFFVPPLKVRQADTGDKIEGLCASCGLWVGFNDNRRQNNTSKGCGQKRPTLWFRHAANCHTYYSPSRNATRLARGIEITQDVHDRLVPSAAATLRQETEKQIEKRDDGI